MDVAFLLARKIHFGDRDTARRASPPAIRIAILGIAIGLAVMVVTVAIIVGFKREIRRKVTSLDAHLQVVALTDNRTAEAQPLVVDDSLRATVMRVPGVTRVRTFSTKLCELKTDSDFLAVAMLGVDGGMPGADGSNDSGATAAAAPSTVILSRSIAERLRLGVGDRVQAYFVHRDDGADGLSFDSRTSVRTRRLTVGGLYETHFSEYDRHVVLVSPALLSDVNGWDILLSPDDDAEADTEATTRADGAEVAAGLQVFIDDFDRLSEVHEALLTALAGRTDRRGTPYYVLSAEQLHPQVFGWLALLDTNVWVILGLMAVVAAFTMISGLLIIILERTATIGVLKALGASDALLRRVFLYVALFLTAKGLLWGNLIGIGLCLVQLAWHPLALDPESYYLEYVPIALEAGHVVLLNVGTLLLTLLVLLGPTAVVARITPTRAIRTE